MASTKQFRQVGSARPSHLMFTGGIGGIVDLPNFAALVGGLDDWEPFYRRGEMRTVQEPRLLDAVQRRLKPSVKELRLIPLSGEDERVLIGVPVRPFPSWLRCTGCNRLAPIASKIFQYSNFKRSRPDLAVFQHRDCGRKGNDPKAVPARFVVVCDGGHLDEFPFVPFVHNGAACPKATAPHLEMNDRAGNRQVDVVITCKSCKAQRNLKHAMGAPGRSELPKCRGHHPHLHRFDPEGCAQPLQTIVVGASNLWFPQTVSVLSVPPDDEDRLRGLVSDHWNDLQGFAALPVETLELIKDGQAQLKPFAEYSAAELKAAMDAHAPGPDEPSKLLDLQGPEWKAFTAARLPWDERFTAVRDGQVPVRLQRYFTDVVRVERLREVRAFLGFTRLDAPDPDDPDLVPIVRTSRGDPTWAPASEVFGEGIFFRVDADALRRWESRIESEEAVRRLEAAWGSFRRRRRSRRLSTGEFDPMQGWPGMGYVALHTLSHLLIRAISLECGYNAASLSERVYDDGGDRAGILIYTAVPDAEGSLGGLVSLAEGPMLTRIAGKAFDDAKHCSGDPVCADHLPDDPADTLHGAACHACLFVSETACERGNRFLDRRFVTDLGGDLSFFESWK